MKAKIIVSGDVQGVGYRYWTYQQIRELNLEGAAENHEDGTVLIQVEGPKEAIQSLADRCKEGSPLAQVSDVQVEWDQ